MSTERSSLPCLLGTRRYEVELKAMRRGTLDSTRTLVDQQAEANDGTLSPTAAWKRTIENFSGGAGQVWADLPEVADRSRHRRSWNLTPFGYRDLRLATKMTDCGPDLSTATATDINAVSANPAEDRVYWIEGDGGTSVDLKYVTSFLNIFPWSAVVTTTGTAMTGYARALLFSGSDVYVVTSTNTYKYSSGSKAVFNATGGWAAAIIGGRFIIGTSGAAIVELDNAGATVGSTPWTHWNSGSYWARNGIVSVGGQIYAALKPTTTTGEIYSVSPDASSSELTDVQLALRMPEGETIDCVAGGSGFMAIATNLGVRLATANADKSLTLGPLFIEFGGATSAVAPFVSGATYDAPTIGDFTNAEVHWMQVQGRYLYMACSVDPSSTDSDDYEDAPVLLIADLSDFVAELTPPWQVLAQVPDEAPFTTHLFVAGNAGWPKQVPESMVLWGGRELLGQVEDQVAESGAWYSGRFTFGTPERKRFQSVEVEFKAMPTGASVDVSLDVDGTTTALGSITAADTSPKTFTVATSGLSGDWAEVGLVLNKGDLDMATPVIERITLRGVPMPDRVDEIYLPLILHERVTPERGRTPVAFNPWEEYAYLRTLLETREPVRFEFGNEVLSVLVDGLYYDGSDPHARIEGWDRDKDWLEGVLTVKLQTLPEAAPEAAEDDGLILTADDGEVILLENTLPLGED